MIHSTLLAAVVPSINGKWTVKEVPTPRPSTNQVLIKVHASGICFSDVHISRGVFGIKFPHILGHEPAGEIVEVGNGVTSRQVGDRVGVPWDQSGDGNCQMCQRGKVVLCPNKIETGINVPGGHAEYMIAYADATQLLPSELSYEQAAPIFCAGFTAYSGLKLADPKPHQRIAVIGIGAVGHLSIQYAKAQGFETIAVTHSRDKEELSYKLGADHVVRNGRELMEIGQADIILSTSNSYDLTCDCLRSIRPHARIILMGMPTTGALILPPDFIVKRASIIGSTQNIFTEREYLYEALDYVAAGKVKVMNEIFSLQEINNAYDRVVNGDVRFKAVIEPNK